MKRELSKKELLDKLKIQLDKISQLNFLYDKGDLHFAQEIAVKLRVLFHDTQNSKSLLRQLKLDHIMFTDTSSTYRSGNLMTHFGLVKMHIDSKNAIARYIPSFEMKREDIIEWKMVPFDNWWEGKEIIVDNLKNSYTRKRLILEVADTDGGAHIDSKLKEDYYRLSRENISGWWLEYKASGKRIPMEDPVPPTIRQISYEVLKTFSKIDAVKESQLG